MKDDASQRAGEPASRLFLAVEVPGPVREVVNEAILPWRASFPNARWIPSENWHVTLKFLGRTPVRLTPWVEETVEQIADTNPPAEVRVSGLGAFPSAQRARVLWAGIEDQAEGLAALVTGLESALAETFRPEMRRFHPHLTVARSEPPIHLPDLYSETPLVSEPFPADRVILFRSHLDAGAPTYEPLRTFPLGG